MKLTLKSNIAIKVKHLLEGRPDIFKQEKHCNTFVCISVSKTFFEITPYCNTLKTATSNSLSIGTQ